MSLLSSMTAAVNRIENRIRKDVIFLMRFLLW